MSPEKNSVTRFMDVRYENASLSKLYWEDSEMKMLENWLNDPLCFFVYLGTPGCGKTYFCAATALYVYQKRLKLTPHPSVYFYPVREIYSEFKRCYAENRSDEEIKTRFSTYKFLVIDDLGASRNTEWQREVMLDIIDRRYDSMLPTIITSNLNFDEIEEVFHLRVRSRLEAMENIKRYDWETDRRLGDSDEKNH